MAPTSYARRSRNAGSRVRKRRSKAALTDFRIGPSSAWVAGRLLSQGAAVMNDRNGPKTASDLGTLTVLLRRCGNGNVCMARPWCLQLPDVPAFLGSRDLCRAAGRGLSTRRKTQPEAIRRQTNGGRTHEGSQV